MKDVDIEADYKNDIDATELKNFRASLYNIKCETYASYTAVETEQIAQQEAQDAPRSQQTTSGKPSTQSKNTDTALPISRQTQSLNHKYEQDTAPHDISPMSDINRAAQ